MPKVTIGLLGSLDLRVGERDVRISGRRQRIILAMLALTPGHVVSVDKLIETVWVGSPPTTARTQIAICVVSLRKALAEAAGGRDVIETIAPGYRLQLEPEQVDVAQFGCELAAAADLTAQGAVAAAVEQLAHALALWRGPAMAGLSSSTLELEAARLEEHRLTAVEKWAELCLELGRHAEVLGELTSIVARFPLREVARAHLMLAQYRAGLRSEALATYRAGRQVSIEEFGLELGPFPQQIHEAILRDDPSLALANRGGVDAGAVVPAQLPAESSGFHGRLAELRALDEVHRGCDRSDPDRDGPHIAYVTGAAGSGKTALAVHWARSVAPAFPDGQLYLDLSATGGEPLATCLRSLGVAPGSIPVERDEQRALYRSILSTRRVIIVLDGACSAEQVSDLVPGAARCCVVIASRQVHYGLLGRPRTVHLPLGPLTEQDAIELLAERAGEARIVADLPAARRLARLCDLLPLALGIVGARLAARPRWSVRQLTERMADESRRLDELSTVEVDMRACLAETCSALTEPEAVLLRRIGGMADDSVSLPDCAALLDTTPARAEDAMERLVDRALAEQVDAAPEAVPAYRLSGLVRSYARELFERLETGLGPVLVDTVLADAVLVDAVPDCA